MGTILICLYLISWSYILSVSSSKVRLVNGFGLPDRGRLEIYDDILGVWGTVCDDFFDTTAAGVACQQLGYPRSNAQVTSSFYFGVGSGRIAYDDVRCSGTETDLSQCQHSRISDCRHAEDVGIICQSTYTSAMCDFEQQCQWSFFNNNTNFYWTIVNGSTHSQDTGPSFDHTTGTSTGHYAYIDNSSPIRTGDVASLISPRLQPSNSRCLHFWYHMHGGIMGTLNVIVSTSTGDSTLWSSSGDPGIDWHHAQVTVYQFTSLQAYHVVIEGIIRSGHHSHIAVDDIFLSSESCSMQFGINIPTSPTTSKTPPVLSSHLPNPTTQKMVTSSEKVTNHVPQLLSCSICEDYLTFRCRSFATECDNTCMIRYKDGRLQTKCSPDQECRNAQQDDFLNLHSSTRCCRSNACVSDTVQQAILASQKVSSPKSSTVQPSTILVPKTRTTTHPLAFVTLPTGRRRK